MTRLLFLAIAVTCIGAGCTCNKGPPAEKLGMSGAEMNELLHNTQSPDGGRCKAYQIIDDANGRHLQCLDLKPVVADGGE